MTIGDAIDNLTEAREHLKAGTPEYIAVVAAHDILRDLLERVKDAIADFVLAEGAENLRLWKLPQEERRYTGPALYDRINAMLEKSGLRAALASTPPPDLLEAARALLFRGLEEMQWCSGSADFGPDGQAHQGWRNGPAKWMEDANAFARALASTPSPEAAPAGGKQ